MSVRFFCAAIICLCAAAAAAQVSSPTLRCTIPATRPGDLDDLVQPSSPQEAARMRQAPLGAARVGHSLEVRWSHGVKWFRERPPYDESLGGLHWVYCGFTPSFGVYLIEKQDNGLFTGVLLNNRTGAMLPAGEDVWFSPNRLFYLASEQPDGQDGPTLLVFQSSGKLVWKGYGGIPNLNGGVAADLVHVGWSDQNRVVMEVALPSGKRQLETLTQKNSLWEWLPKIVQ